MVEKVTLPKGTYYVGDPCYCFREQWLDVLNASDYFEEPYKRGKLVAVGFGTGGDGEFPDQTGFYYDVDSGTLGVVPVHMAEQQPDLSTSRLVKFSTPFDCYKEGTMLHFGDIAIELEPEDEEDECCSECGRPY